MRLCFGQLSVVISYHSLYVKPSQPKLVPLIFIKRIRRGKEFLWLYNLTSVEIAQMIQNEAKLSESEKTYFCRRVWIKGFELVSTMAVATESDWNGHEISVPAWSAGFTRDEGEVLSCDMAAIMSQPLVWNTFCPMLYFIKVLTSCLRTCRISHSFNHHNSNSVRHTFGLDWI